MDQGHTVVSQNLATGTTIDEKGLLSLAPLYTREYLATFTFRHFVSTFEAFYLRKAGKKKRYDLGAHIEIDDSYHLESWRLIKNVVSAMTSAAVAKVEA